MAEYDTHAIDDLPSRTPDSPVRSALRADPFWGGSWVPRSAAVWVDRRSAEAQQHSKLAHVPARFLIDPDDAWESIQRDWSAKAKALAVLDSYRTASAEQIAAATGHHLLAGRYSRALHQLFALGLIEYAQAVTPFRAHADAAARHLWRPAVAGRRMRAKVQREQMTWTEWVLASGGRPWEAARQYARHDSLGLELALRAAEYLPSIAAVAGEKFTSLRDVLFESWGNPFPLTGAFGNIADGMLVRRDGLRIIIEMSASGADESDRARRYARALSLGSTKTQGTIVVFLAAGKPEFSDRAARATANLKDAVAHATRIHAGEPGARTADRMFVADWSEWFPGEHTVSDRFLDLTAWRAPQANETNWQPVSMLADQWAVPDGAIASAGRLAALYQSPAWLRERAPKLQLAEQLATGFYGGEIPAQQYTPTGAGSTTSTPERIRS